MKIGIDARLIDETGVGRYIRNLMHEISLIDTKNTYVIFLKKQQFGAFAVPNAQWRKVVANVPWHSIREQFIMPWIVAKEHIDVLHVPYFTVPIFYPGRMVVTVHDLTILNTDTGKASTLPWWAYQCRRLGYRIVLRVGLHRARELIVVSDTTKKELLKQYPHIGSKTTVICEGVDQKLLHAVKSPLPASIRKNNYFLYVGNAYPHKNLDTLLDAYIEYVTKENDAPAQLVLVGKPDFFYDRLLTRIKKMNLLSHVRIFHEVTDSMLSRLYEDARALVFPSIMEGFGLPALEAKSFGCPVICSDIPVFHEILGTEAEYVPTMDVTGWTKALLQAGSRGAIGRSKEMIHQNNLNPKFSWSEAARKTLFIYERCARV